MCLYYLYKTIRSRNDNKKSEIRTNNDQDNNKEIRNNEDKDSNKDEDKVNNDKEGCWKAVRKMFQEHSIYLVIILFFFSSTLFSSSRVAGFDEKVCSIQYDQSISGVDCTDLGSFPDQQKVVQKIASDWNLYNAIASLSTAIPATLIWSAWGDLHGRKLPLLLPQVGTALSNFVYIVLLSTPVTQLWIMTITNVIFSMFGGASLIRVVILQVVADQTSDKRWLVAKYGIAYGMVAVGAVIGSTIGGKTLKTIGFINTFLIAQAGLAVCAIYTVTCFVDTNDTSHPHSSPGKHGDSTDSIIDGISVPAINDTPPPSPPHGACSSILEVVKSTLSLLREVYRTYAKPRIEHRRLFLILTFIIFLLANTSNDEFESALNQYVLKAPISWQPHQYSSFNGFYIAMQVIGSIVVSIVFKVLFGVRDTGMILISVASLLGMLIIVGLSTHSWMIWLGGAVGSCQGLLIPSLNAFVARTVHTGEIGKILAGNNVAGNIADIISTVIYYKLYALTLDWYSGFPFLFGAGLSALAFVIAVGLQIGAKMNMTMEKPPSLQMMFSRNSARVDRSPSESVEVGRRTVAVNANNYGTIEV